MTKDRLCSLLEEGGKLYTVLRIDEINILDAARIRIRTLLAAMNQRQREKWDRKWDKGTVNAKKEGVSP